MARKKVRFSMEVFVSFFFFLARNTVTGVINLYVSIHSLNLVCGGVTWLMPIDRLVSVGWKLQAVCESSALLSAPCCARQETLRLRSFIVAGALDILC